MEDPSLIVLLLLGLAAVTAGFVDAVVGGGGLVQLPALLLGLPGEVLLRVELGLLIGTPGLAALGLATGALVAGLRGAGAVAGLVMLPLAVPLLVFGGGMVEGGAGAVKLLAAVSLLLTAGAPFVAAAAMRAGMD